jgi:hypothetical protein
VGDNSNLDKALLDPHAHELDLVQQSVRHSFKVNYQVAYFNMKKLAADVLRTRDAARTRR